MSSETSPCHWGLVLERLSINRGYGDLTPCVPLSLIRRGGGFGRGADAPSDFPITVKQ